MQYQSKPKVVEARQITEANIEEISAWCGGDVTTICAPSARRFIEMHIDGHDVACVGDWILNDGTSFSIWKDAAFRQAYTPAQGVEVDGRNALGLSGDEQLELMNIASIRASLQPGYQVGDAVLRKYCQLGLGAAYWDTSAGYLSERDAIDGSSIQATTDAYMAFVSSCHPDDPSSNWDPEWLRLSRLDRERWCAAGWRSRGVLGLPNDQDLLILQNRIAIRGMFTEGFVLTWYPYHEQNVKVLAPVLENGEALGWMIEQDGVNGEGGLRTHWLDVALYANCRDMIENRGVSMFSGMEHPNDDDYQHFKARAVFEQERWIAAAIQLYLQEQLPVDSDALRAFDRPCS